MQCLTLSLKPKTNEKPHIETNDLAVTRGFCYILQVIQKRFVRG